MTRATFPLRRSGQEAEAILQRRFVEARQARVAVLAARSTFWRRLLCALTRHRPWASGLGAKGPGGELVQLHVCERCGRKQVELAR